MLHTRQWISIVIRGIGALCHLALFYAVASRLNPEETSTYFVSTSSALLAALMCRLGLDEIATREAARAATSPNYVAESQPVREGPGWLLFPRLVTFVSAGVAIVGLVGSELLARLVPGLHNDYSASTLIGPLVAVQARLQMTNALLRGGHSVNYVQLQQLVAIPVGTIALLLVTGAESPSSALFAFLMVNAGALTIAEWRWYRTARSLGLSAHGLRTVIPHLAEARSLLLAGLTATLVTRATPVLAGIGTGGHAAGTLALCSRIANAAILPATAIYQHATRDLAACEREIRAAVFRKMRIIAILASAPPICLTIALADGLINVISGPVSDGSTVLFALLAGNSVTILLGPVLSLAVAIDKPHLVSRPTIVSGALALTMVPILSALSGPIGAGIGVGIATGVQTVLIARRTLHCLS